MAEAKKRRSLGEILIDFGVIDQDQLEHALSVQKEKGGKLGEVLEVLGFCTVEDVEWSLSTQYDLPLARVRTQDVSEEVARLLPAGLCRAGTLIATWATDDEIGIVMADPTNGKIVEAVRNAMPQHEITFSLGIPSEIRKVIYDIFGDEGASATALGLYDSDLFDAGEASQINADPSGEQFLTSLFGKAWDTGAQAVYFEPRGGYYVIRFKEPDGVQDVVRCQRDWYILLLEKLSYSLTERQQRSFGIEAGRYDTVIEDAYTAAFDVRIYDSGLVKAATCTSRANAEDNASLTNIDFGPAPDRIAEQLEGRGGAVLVTGAGKRNRRSLLHAFLEALNRPNRKAIAKAEDDLIPFERVEDRKFTLFPFEEGRHLSDDYSSLRDLKAQVLFIQNARPHSNPLSIALQSELDQTHLLSNVSGRNAMETAQRLLAGEPKLFAMLTNSMIVAGRSVKLLCKDCRTELDLPPMVREELGIDGPLYAALGCRSCGQSGYRDEIFLAEYLPLNQNTADILDNPKALSQHGYVPVEPRVLALLGMGEIAYNDFMAFRFLAENA